MLEYAETANQTADLQEEINHTFAILNEADRLIKQAATRYNHGRARKVSFRRPSPQMSRAYLSRLKAESILHATLTVLG